MSGARKGIVGPLHRLCGRGRCSPRAACCQIMSYCGERLPSTTAGPITSTGGTMLKNDKFGFKRYWLLVALKEIPRQPEIFANKNLSEARKAFLAGKNQLVAIKNWLELGDIVAPASPRKHQLTEIGQLMLESDPQGQEAWTWWLFHLHLCANAWTCPYSTSFTTYELEDAHWLEFTEVVKKLHGLAVEAGETVSESTVSESTVESYFEGVDRSFRPGSPFYGLGLIERRAVDGEVG